MNKIHHLSVEFDGRREVLRLDLGDHLRTEGFYLDATSVGGGYFGGGGGAQAAGAFEAPF